MITLNTLFHEADIDPRTVIVMRHRPAEPSMRRKLPWIVAERPDLFLTYQAIQWKNAEKALSKARYLASFIGSQPGEATFAGLFEVLGARELRPGEYLALPQNQELMSLGMAGREPGDDTGLIFDLSPAPFCQEWIGRLLVRWPPPERSWWRWSDRNTLPVQAIVEESLFSQHMPCWTDIVLGWSDLSLLPRAWKDRLREWRGIYYIFDAARNAGYVGSAYGEDNILGRWMNYARTGHGGNVQLRASTASDLRFSILERTSPDLASEAIVALENSWKARLHSKEHGLNSN